MNHLAKVSRVLAATAFVVMVAAVPALAQSTYAVFVAGIDGLTEVPPNDLPQTGHATLFLNEDETQVSYYISYDALPTETAAHFHLAPPGVNGPVIHPLPAGNPKIGVWDIAPEHVAALYAGEVYVNIHTSEYPAGAIRGNLEFCVVPNETSTWGGVKALFQ